MYCWPERSQHPECGSPAEGREGGLAEEEVREDDRPVEEHNDSGSVNSMDRGPEAEEEQWNVLPDTIGDESDDDELYARYEMYMS